MKTEGTSVREMPVRRVALAYSGGLDTSVMIPWLRERYGCQVVAVVVDVGQREELEAVREKALRTGAVAAEVVDRRCAFLEEAVFPALRAGAVYEGRYLLGTALARPVIARAQVEAARRHGCDALAHGCTGKGNDQVRFELAYQALAPDLRVLAPWREWEIGSREEAIDYARARGIPVPVTRKKPYSVDRNLWHTSFEGGVLEDPAHPAPDLHDLTADPISAPDLPETVEIEFEAGVPVAVDGERLPAVELVEALNRRAGIHGVGRVDLVENRLVGMKSRGIYETPAGTVLTAAVRDLEALTLDRHVAAFKEGIGRRYAELVYQGLWHSPLRASLDAFVASACRHVTGTVTVRLYKGSALPVARSSPWSLYREDLATFGEAPAATAARGAGIAGGGIGGAGSDFDPADAAGFIRLWGLPGRVHAAVHGGAAAAAGAGGAGMAEAGAPESEGGSGGPAAREAASAGAGAVAGGS